MTWYTHAPTFADPQTFGASEDFKGIVNNFPAMAARDAGAPVMDNGGWYPFDMAAIGDGATGEIYSFGADGAVASVETPDFADGFEYQLFVDRLTPATTGANLIVDLYRETDAAYTTAYTTTNGGGVSGTGLSSALVQIIMPRTAKTVHPVTAWFAMNGTVETANTAVFDSTVQKISKGRVRWSSGNITAGAIYLYRRGMQQ